MNLEQEETQTSFWESNKNRILRDYPGRFGVIDWMQYTHFKTREEVYRVYPVLARNDLFGNRPLLIDIVGEQWKGHVSSKQKLIRCCTEEECNEYFRRLPKGSIFAETRFCHFQMFVTGGLNGVDLPDMRNYGESCRYGLPVGELKQIEAYSLWRRYLDKKYSKRHSSSKRELLTMPNNYFPRDPNAISYPDGPGHMRGGIITPDVNAR